MAAALPEKRFSALYSSDLTRVRQTAEPAAARLGLAPRLEPALRERHYGAFQSLTYAEALERMPQAYARFEARDPEFDFDGGESLNLFARRVLSCLQSIARRHRGEHVLLFTHGGVIDVAYRHAAELPLSAPRTFETPNAAFNWIEAGERWKVLGWAECAHLQ